VQVRLWKGFCEDEHVRFYATFFPLFINTGVPGPLYVLRRYFLRSDSHWNEDDTMVAEPCFPIS